MFARENHARPEKIKQEGGILGPIKFNPVEVQEVDQDIATESMKLIDGWGKLPPIHVERRLIDFSNVGPERLDSVIVIWR